VLKGTSVWRPARRSYAKKKITQAVLDANSANANKPRGERSPAGKLSARLNAVKDGFFAKELALTESEKLELQFLRRALCAELSPATALQNVAFEKVVCCVWRTKLAVRLETRRMSAVLDGSDGQEVQPEIPEGAPVISSWYLSGRQELRDAIRFLESVMADFEANGVIRKEWKEPLDRAFGVGFFDELTKWTPIPRDVLLLTNHLVQHAKIFKRPLPPMPGKQPAEVVIDPAQGYQMVGKLLERELQHLRGLSVSWAQRASQTIEVHNAVADFAPRFFTAASRDLNRAVEWYQHLKEQKL
jgi:hypothetical protein